jgi:hypothetical protein
MELDIYDFDKTIVPFDSGTLFVGYCMLHYPWCILYLPVILCGLILMLCRVISFTQFKRICFMFYPMIPKKRAVQGFWDRHEHQVHDWFKSRRRYSVVISASPDFLLDEIHQRLGFEKLLCTLHDPRTGAIIGENCRGEEKVRRLYEEFELEDIEVVDVYSDSLKFDRPIFALASGKCYHIVDGEKNEFIYCEVYKDNME